VLAAEPASGGLRLTVRCEGVDVEAPQVKDSIAIDGVCLTASAVNGEAIAFDVVPETLAHSTLRGRVAGDGVNVEYALRVGDRIGGHFVYGHVDAAGRVLELNAQGQGRRLRIATPRSIAPMIAHKGFVAVDGVSLTVAAVNDDSFEVVLIPETLARTTLGSRTVGDRVNLEADPLARYVSLCHPERSRGARGG
jgi:riboflavin synthase